MRWQTTAVLAAFLLALGTFFYLYEVRWGPAREEAAARKGRLFAADTKDVTEIVIKRPEDTVRLKREGDNWEMLEPLRARGSRPAVDETLANLMTAKIDREITAKPESLVDFGLDKPAADVTLMLKDGKTLGVTLGAKTPTGVWVYARERDKPAVFVLGESVLRDSTRPLADFRDRSVLAFDPKAVTGFEVVLPDETLAVENADGAWRLTKPTAQRADTETITDFLDKLNAQKVREFVADGPPSRAPYGLERPTRVTIHTGRDKDRVSRSLLLGKVDPAKKGIYAMRPDEPTVLLVGEELWNAVPKNVAVLRNRTLVEVDRDKVTRLQIEGSKGMVEIAREGDQWKIVAPEPLATDQVEVGAVLSRVRELRAQAFLSDDASGIGKFLAKPEVKLTFTQQGGATTTLLLAPSQETRGKEPSAYAALVGSGPVVLVDAKALGELNRSATDLRDRRLLGNLEPKDIKRMRVRAGGQTVVLERKGDTEWRMVEPTKGAAKTAKVDDLLYTLRGLRWTDIAAADGQDPARYGLDTPTLEVALFKGDGGEIATVQVGKRDGANAYVRTGAQPTVYRVEGRTLGETPKVPDDFKG
ncbi:MAG TPA: DUF4340 domain-containing protein [Patescibacteria group bacterium]|nr:DUF4340 domain-containing protein [Patescibacteria group bacterium]